MDDEGRIAGMLAVCCEQTQSIIFAERMNVLRDVSMSATNTSSVDVALNGIATALAGRKTTVPFAIIYLADSNTEHLVLTKTIGLDTTANPNTAPARVKIGKDVKDDIWSLNVALASGLTEVTDVQNFAQVVGGPWDDLVHTAVVLPIRSSSHHDSKALGVMVGAVNPNKALDADYRSFYRLIASQVFIAVTNAKAHEEERKRAEMLLELDRQKQVFFSNVSHELRTPLTLSIAPLEQALSLPEPSIDAEGIRLIYRNASRLLRLVNTLLDFSRIETGTTSISFSAIDLSTVTAEMASSFQSLCDKAGIKLSVNAHPLSEAVWVSVNHWEKVVLNLLSNSFKYTLEGHIRVTVQPLTPEVQAELFSEIDGSTVTRYVAFSVADTGVGIPQKDIPLIFDRFHRVESSKGRSYEGTGIGLSLVREIVQFHSGFIAVRSLEGTGSTFTVVLPLGDSHIPPERKVDAGAIEILRGSASANQAVVAASQWLSDDLSTGGDGQSSAELSPRGVTDPIVEWLSISTIGNSCGYVLCVDDNRDMRSYLQTLLSPFCEVGSAANGRAALDSIQKRLPDLIISDIQMPEMDGKMLAKTLRSSKFRAKLSVIAAAGRKGDDHDTPVDPRWDYHALYVPIILLSARAGPEAIKDGLETGADDYICKPFHVPELVSRVKSQLAMSKTRRDWAAQMLAAQRKAIAAAEANSQFARQFLAIMSHEMRTPLNAVIGMTDLLLDTQLDAEQKEFVETVRSSGSHLQVIINETLDYSKIESGKLELEPHPVVIRQILEEAVDIVSSSASSNDLLFVWSIHPSTPNIVICDLARLKQVLINLLNNAAKFTAEGHVSVYIRYELDDQSGNTFGSPSPPSSETCHGTPEAHMRNTTPSGTLHISVKDTGFGISPRAQHRLFQPFSQIDSHATRVYGGTGLGLAVCKRLVQLMGGDIMCDSSGVPGEGATFRFWISAPPAPVHSLHDRMAAISLTDSSRITPPSSGITSDPLLHRPVPTLMGRRVLLIVPNGEANKIWARQLVVWGMSVVPVVAAGEAIRFLRHVAGKLLSRAAPPPSQMDHRKASEHHVHHIRNLSCC
ncbi:histidine kinase-like ATPase [Powellomyces hirtus]|nr:histidine kinase-like ATPase [Powellomyces hirtus]